MQDCPAPQVCCPAASDIGFPDLHGEVEALMINILAAAFTRAEYYVILFYLAEH